jgi:hypothetical protein
VFETGKPIAGFYKRRLVRGGPWVGVKLWFGQPVDPSDPTNEMDRSPRWQALVNGIEAEPYDAWIGACSNPITEEEYCRLIGVEEPHRPLDWKRGAPIF